MAEHVIKTNARGISQLLLKYPLELRLRCKRMAQATQQPEQQIIRSGIEQIVAAWEAQNSKQPDQPASRTGSRPKAATPRRRRAKHPLGATPKTRKAGAK
jgi:hypothetical protein